MSAYRYYDTPDGQDWAKKQYYLIRKAMIVSGMYTPIDVIYLTTPKGFFPVVERIIRTYTRPLLAVSLFGTGTYVATKLRGKDDGWNHVIGNFCSFKYWSYLYPRPQVVWSLFVFSSVLFFGFKDAKVTYGEKFVHEYYDAREWVDNTVFADFFHYSVLKKMPRKWLTTEEAKEKGLL